MLLLTFSTQFLLLDRMKQEFKKIHVAAHNSKNHISSFYICVSADNTYKRCFAGVSLLSISIDFSLLDIS